MRPFVIRIVYLMLGVWLYALGIVLTLKANIGFAPWEVFHVGLANTIGLSIGVTSIIAGVVILVIVTLLGEKFGIGTLASAIVTGLFLDLILYWNVIPVANTILSGSMMMVAGIFIIALGSYYYIKSAFGVGPRDNLMVVLAKRIKIPVGVWRGVIELSVTTIGWFLGGMVGLGTVIFVITIGLGVQIVFKIFKFDVTTIQHESLKDTYLAFLTRTS
jgi:uncharacterized membrane protein YczE